MLKQVESERKGRVLSEKKLAEADLLVEKAKREATVLLAKMKQEKIAFSDILKSQKVLAKKQVDAEAAMTAAQLQLKKDALAEKAAVKKEMKILKVSYDTLQKVGLANKTKISALNFAQTSWMKTKAGLQSEVRDLSKDLKTLTKKFDAQLQKKLDHELSIQKLRNNSKKLELELVREKLNEKFKSKKVSPSTTPKKSASLTLLEKKDFETHKAEVKRQATTMQPGTN
jgi:predicted CopG family antitoxin